MSRDMARIVGPIGHVTGNDFDPHVLEFARADAKKARAGNVEFVTADTSGNGEFSSRSTLPDPIRI